MPIDFTLWLSYLFIVLLLTSMVCLVVAFLIRFFVPKGMEETCFQEPFFSPAEIAIYSAFPFNFFKPFIFMRLAGFPQSGKKRGLTEAYKLAPLWFRQFSRAFIWVFLLSGVSMIILGNILNLLL
jgi:hypothetical protein